MLKTIRNIILSIILFLSIILTSNQVHAKNTTNIEIHVPIKHGETIPFSMYELYRIGSTSINGIELIDALEPMEQEIISVLNNDLDLNTLQKLQDTIESLIYANNVEPLKISQINDDHTVLFDQIENGLYLISAYPFQIEEDDKTYIYFPQSFLVEVINQETIKVFNKVTINEMTQPHEPNDPTNESLYVTKSWNDKGVYDRASSIHIALYCDGEKIDCVELSKDNDWQHEFVNLPPGTHKWVVVEEDIPPHYSINIQKETNGFHITNTRYEELKPIFPPHELPSTNDVGLPYLTFTISLLTIALCFYRLHQYKKVHHQ